jgi:hypothetical protein
MATHVLWGQDHAERGKELALAYSGTYENVTTKPHTVNGLTHLSYWGHGIPSGFCELSPRAFVDNLKAWKKANKDISKVDILTCNGRFTGDGNKSFTDQVQDLIRTRSYSSLRDISLLGLPKRVTPSGKTCNFSILSRDPTTKSWSYVAAPGFFTGTSSQHEGPMFGAKYFLDMLLRTPTGRQSYIHAYSQMMNLQKLTTTSAFAVWKKWDQARIDKFNADMKKSKEDAFIMVGNSVGSLIWHLREIR